MSSHEYKQRDGSDKWRTSDADGNREYTGRAKYDSDGSLKRYDNYSQFSSDGDHRHEWINKNSDGSYEYGTHPPRNRK